MTPGITRALSVLLTGKALRGAARGKVQDMKYTSERGSARLIDAYKNRGVEFGDELVSRLSESLEAFDIHDVLIKGIVHPDFLRAGFSVRGEEEASKAVLEVLSTIKDVPLSHIRLFPKGIPWPEIFNVEIVVGQR